MKYCECPNCGNKQELYQVEDMINPPPGTMSMFTCASCGFDTQIRAEKQSLGRVVLFFALAIVEEG